MPPALDLVITNGTVVTMNAGREVLANVDIVVKDGRNFKLGKNLARAADKSGGKGRRSLKRTVDAAGMVVIPGLVQGHIHACQTLFRNRADGLELLEWLRERIWPFEGAHDRDSMRSSADLTFAELIKSGTTAALDMGTVRHYDAVFESARDCGFRLTGGKAMMDSGQGVPASLRETTADSLAESVRLCKDWHGSQHNRLRYAFAPRFVLSCTEGLLRATVKAARELGARIHTHASENSTECDVVRQKTGTDNVAYLAGLGIAGPQVTLAHCVWLTAAEHRILRETKTVVCHCPSSNLKLASGIAKIPELLAEGVNLCLGADGAPCNNNLDMFVEMRLAALLHKPRAGPLAMSPLQVLEMATLGGARALGLEKEIGSIEEGKRADLVVVDLNNPGSLPAGPDPISQLVYAGQSSHVRHVLIDGKLVMRDRELLTLNEPEVCANASAHALRLVERVG
jgi:5-methylthioadenosine/S-adenosylhomocysteine deaminase